jgi:hypothetical protein
LNAGVHPVGYRSTHITGKETMGQQENTQGIIILQTPEKLQDPEVLKQMLEANQ